MMESQGTKNYKYFKAHPFLKLLNTLSIDVVIGSILSSFLVVRLLNIEPGWAFWIVLPVSVWIIYTLDHIIDAFRLKKQANTYRHYFHYLHLKRFIIIIATISVLDLTLLLCYLEKEIIYFGVVVSIATIAYLLLIHFSGKKGSLLPKEIPVSIIYTFGIWGGPFALTNFNISTGQIILMIIFFLLVLADVLLLSFYEVGSDKKDNHSTITAKFGQAVTTKIIVTIIIAVYLLSFFIIFTDELFLHRSIAKLYLFMGLIQIIIIGVPQFFEKNKLYRYIIELVLWIPGFIVLI